MKTPYLTSFTAGGLLYEETLRVLPLITEADSENLLKQEAVENKYIMINSEAARKRVLQEIRKRIRLAPEDFWDEFQSSSDGERRLMLFFLSLKTYELIRKLHMDVTVTRFKAGDRTLAHHPYEIELDSIGDSSDKIRLMTDNTRRKVITVYIRMLREASLAGESELRKPVVQNRLWNYFEKMGDHWFEKACFI